MLWCQKKVDEGSRGKVKVGNFHTSWQDGTAFASLIQAYRPDLIDASSLKPPTSNENKVENLNQCFSVAQEHLGIPRMLDPVDMVNCARPDEKSVMTYVAFFWKEFASTKRKQLAAERIGLAVQREIALGELEAQYEELGTSLAQWMEATTARHSATEAANSDDLQACALFFMSTLPHEHPPP